MTESKVWFITGASSGFGRCLTDHLLKQGHKVVATLRKPEVLSDLAAQYPSTCLAVKLDVTQHAEISAAFAKAREVFGRVDVVFNNAGQMLNGELESADDKDAREMFEINFWGAAQVSREAVRFFREVNQPKVADSKCRLVWSSGVSRATDITVPHSNRKFAIEGLTGALADELNPAWNIKVTLLRPGPFRTEIAAGNRIIVPAHPAYPDPELSSSKWRRNYEAGGSMDGDLQKACIAFEKVSLLEDTPLRLPLHKMALCMAKAKGKSLIDNAEKYKDWSDDLYL